MAAMTTDPAPKGVVRILPDGPGRVTFKPKGYLGDGLFGAYQDACSGSRFDGTRRCQTATVEVALGIVGRLQREGFALQIDASLTETLRTEIDATKERVEDASARVERIDASLRAKGLRLFPYQKTDVSWISSRKRYLNASEMGMGKSVETLASLPDAGTCGLLVIAPAIAKGVWTREAAKWRPEFKVTTISGHALERCDRLSRSRRKHKNCCAPDIRWLKEVPIYSFEIRGHVEVCPSIRLNAVVLDAARPSAIPAGKLLPILRVVEKIDRCRDHVDSFRWPATGEIVIINYDILPPAAKVARKKFVKVIERPSIRGGLQSLGLVGALAPPITPAAPEPPRQAPPASRLPPCPQGVIVIADEAHLAKAGNQSARGRAFRAISEAARKAHGSVGLLTATPQLNLKPQEIWNVLEAADLAREAFGSFKEFMRLYGGRQGKWGIEWPDYKASTQYPLPEVGERLRRVMIRRLKKDHFSEMPQKIHRSIEVDLDRGVLKEADEVLDALAERGLDLDDPEFLEKAETIAFAEVSKLRSSLATAKIPAMMQMVEQHEDNDEPCLVFSMHRAPIDMLGKREGWIAITGDVKTEERTRIENDFQAGKYKGIALTIQAGGLAITLTRASSVVFVDRAFTPALNDQASDRAHRIGQTKTVIVTSLVGDHKIERRVDELLTQKRALIERSVERAIQKEDSPAPSIPNVDFALLAAAAEAEEKRQGTAKKPRRGPKTPREEWAKRALLTLAMLDPDRAAELNDMGFNATDGGFGHSLAAQVKDQGLTEKQWSMAVVLCSKYQRQVGPLPPRNE